MHRVIILITAIFATVVCAILGLRLLPAVVQVRTIERIPSAALRIAGYQIDDSGPIRTVAIDGRDWLLK